MVTLEPIASYAGTSISIPVLIALLVCLIPTTIGALISAIGIAGMDRLVQQNVLAMSGRAVEAAGDVDTLLLDKTGTITSVTARLPSSVPRPASAPRPWPTRRSSHHWPTKHRKAARSSSSPRSNTACAGREFSAHEATFVPFSAHTRISGIDFNGRVFVRARWMLSSGSCSESGNTLSPEVRNRSSVFREKATPRRPSRKTAGRSASFILKDIVKGGIRDRFAHFARWASRP